MSWFGIKCQCGNEITLGQAYCSGGPWKWALTRAICFFLEWDKSDVNPPTCFECSSKYKQHHPLWVLELYYHHNYELVKREESKDGKI